MSKTKNQESKITCPVCGSSGLWIFYTVKNVPASCNRLWKSKNDSINCPKGDIELGFCTHCTFVSNTAIEPEKNLYDNQYDNSLFYSAHFQVFAKKLATDLIKRYNLYNKNVVEIGGGKVDFLSLFNELGKNNGSKFDPFSPNTMKSNQKADFPETVLNLFPFMNEGKNIDFIFSYHELEHINDPKNFLKNLRMTLDRNKSVRVFFSVPNALKAFEEGDYSDIIYEHVSYFTIPSLYFLFSSCGFEISNVKETKGEIFDSLFVDATLKMDKLSSLGLNSEFQLKQIQKSIKRFASKTEQNIKGLCQKIIKLLDRGNRIVIWGAGARGVTFLNVLNDQRIEYAVDINPCKHGMFVPGTGQKIVGPEFLVDYQPDFIILANPSYENEIKQITRDLRITSDFISLSDNSLFVT